MVWVGGSDEDGTPVGKRIIAFCFTEQVTEPVKHGLPVEAIPMELIVVAAKAATARVRTIFRAIEFFHGLFEHGSQPMSFQKLAVARATSGTVVKDNLRIAEGSHARGGGKIALLDAEFSRRSHPDSFDERAQHRIGP